MGLHRWEERGREFSPFFLLLPVAVRAPAALASPESSWERQVLRSHPGPAGWGSRFRQNLQGAPANVRREEDQSSLQMSDRTWLFLRIPCNA